MISDVLLSLFWVAYLNYGGFKVSLVLFLSGLNIVTGISVLHSFCYSPGLVFLFDVIFFGGPCYIVLSVIIQYHHYLQ